MGSRSIEAAALACAVVLTFAVGAPVATAATIVVNDSSDTLRRLRLRGVGDGHLYAARRDDLRQRQPTDWPHEIHFALAGAGVHTIKLDADLPSAALEPDDRRLYTARLEPQHERAGSSRQCRSSDRDRRKRKRMLRSRGQREHRPRSHHQPLRGIRNPPPSGGWSIGRRGQFHRDRSDREAIPPECRGRFRPRGTGRSGRSLHRRG